MQRTTDVQSQTPPSKESSAEIGQKTGAERRVSRDMQRRTPDEMIEHLKSQSATAKQINAHRRPRMDTASGMRDSAKRASASANRMTIGIRHTTDSTPECKNDNCCEIALP